MPKLLSTLTNDEQVFQIPGTNFSFSGVRPDKLGASEYTLVTLVIDITGSVSPFATVLLAMLKEIVKACQKHPRKENLMLRVVAFNTVLYEIHPFKPILDIDPNDYKDFVCDDMTALYDATIYGIGGTQTYAEVLTASDIDVNGCIFVLTDGGNNAGRYTAADVKKRLEEVHKKETLQSLLTVLIGINSGQCRAELQTFQVEGGLSQYVDVADASAGKLAKLGGFISQSVSSCSQALASKTPSVPISVTF